MHKKVKIIIQNSIILCYTTFYRFFILNTAWLCILKRVYIGRVCCPILLNYQLNMSKLNQFKKNENKQNLISHTLILKTTCQYFFPNTYSHPSKKIRVSSTKWQILRHLELYNLKGSFVMKQKEDNVKNSLI